MLKTSIVFITLSANQLSVNRLEKLVEIRNQQLSRLGPSAKVAVFAYGERHAVKILKSICSDHSSLYFAVTDQSTHLRWPMLP